MTSRVWHSLKSGGLLFLFFATNQPDLKADLILGLHVSGDRLVYAYQKKISLKSVSADTVIAERELCKDTGITMPLYHKAVKLNRLSQSQDIDQLKKSVQDFSIVNLTFYQNKIYAGIRYHLGKSGHSKICFGIIVLDQNLQMLNYYLFKFAKAQAFSIPPYFPMEFEGAKHLILPDIDSGKMLIAKFHLDDSLHEASRSAIVKKNVQISHYNQIKFPENLILDPVLFSVCGSAYKLYFQFPQPVIFKNGKSKFLDPGGLGNDMKSNRVPGLGDGTHLLFERQIRRDSSVILATCTQNDSIFILSSSLLPGFVELYRCESLTGTYSPRWIRTETTDRYFLLSERRLIIFYIKDSKSKIEVKSY